MTFRQLIAGANLKGVIIARFLAVLELYRQGSIGYDQIEPLGELTLHWTAEHWTDDSLANSWSRLRCLTAALPTDAHATD